MEYSNKKAHFLYEIIEDFNAGIQLLGTEIKSLRNGKANINETYCLFQDGELYIRNMYIAEYEMGGYVNHEPRRDRKLLLTKRELNRMEKKIKEKGFTIVPIVLFINEKGLAKVNIGLARGKKMFDKREDIKQKDTKRELERLDYRMVWEDDFRAYLAKLASGKEVIVCGDMNVAHNEIDLANPSTNHFNAGFSDEERGKFSELLSSGFVDSWRAQHPDTVKYSWWSYRMRARERNVGWRIDYFLVTPGLMPSVEGTDILNDVFGSDHCPVELDLKD